MKLKSEARIFLQNFVTLIETQFHAHIKYIRSHNGLEFSLP